MSGKFSKFKSIQIYMAILLADSGSTKTDWLLVDKGQVVTECQTIGFNPYFQTSEQIAHEIRQHLLPCLQPHLSHIEHIAYYGAGCSNDKNKDAVKHGIELAFGPMDIEVDHDLIGAARALCGNEKGIACILGTGSNSCLYDGREVTENIVSLGYFFGDQGSGAYIGKTFIQNYFDGLLPAHITKAFEEQGYNRESILENMYKKPMPNRYLASVSSFILNYKEEPFVRQMLKKCFHDFFDAQVSRYTNSHQLPVNSVGSIGYFYKDIFTEAAADKGFHVGTIIRSPIEGLIRYHHS